MFDLERPDWMQLANCRNVDVEAFFPSRGEDITPATEVCKGCVVRSECLEYAMANNEHHGIWGGMSERGRRRLRAKRKREAKEAS